MVLKSINIDKGKNVAITKKMMTLIIIIWWLFELAYVCRLSKILITTCCHFLTSYYLIVFADLN